MKNKILNHSVLNLLIWAASSLGLVLVDQLTKLMVVAKLKGQPPFVIWDGVFELLYSENRGAAFGMLQGRQGFFFLIAAVVLLAAAYVMYRMPDWKARRYHWLKLCTIMITAGAVGNMVDRISNGYVVDFLYFKLINFPIFNVADIYVTVATGILLVLMCFYYREEELEIFRLRPNKSDLSESDDSEKGESH